LATQQVYNKFVTQIQQVGDAHVTQLNKETTPIMCPALQNDVNLIRHLLVKETDDANVPFTIYLTKKQKMSLRRPLITLVLRVNPRMVE